jgi:glycosyl transferase, family 25
MMENQTTKNEPSNDNGKKNRNSNPWDVYDRIVCLNLRERQDRYEHMKQEFQKIGIVDCVEFLINNRSPLGGVYGCFESHWKAIKQAYDDNIAHLLVFEDDVLFKEGYEELSKIVQTLFGMKQHHGNSCV